MIRGGEELEQESIELSDGKYIVVLEDNPFRFYALRHGQFWKAGDRLDNLHMAMFQRIRDLEGEIARNLTQNKHRNL